MKNFVTGCLLSTITMFVWGAIFWMSAWPYSELEQTLDDDSAGESSWEHFSKSGTYIIPGIYNDDATHARLHNRGSIATIHIQRKGRAVMEGSVFVFGFLHELITVILIALLIKMALPALQSYRQRLGFVTTAGVAAAFFTNVGNPVWWYHPWKWYFFTATYHITAWVVVGLILAKFIRPVSENEY